MLHQAAECTASGLVSLICGSLICMFKRSRGLWLTPLTISDVMSSSTHRSFLMLVGLLQSKAVLLCLSVHFSCQTSGAVGISWHVWVCNGLSEQEVQQSEIRLEKSQKHTTVHRYAHSPCGLQ